MPGHGLGTYVGYVGLDGYIRISGDGFERSEKAGHGNWISWTGRLPVEWTERSGVHETGKCYIRTSLVGLTSQFRQIRGSTTERSEGCGPRCLCLRDPL